MNNNNNQNTRQEEIVIPELIISEQGVPLVSSLDIAKVFEKDHKKILKNIENLLNSFSNYWGRYNIRRSIYINTNENGTVRENPMYFLTHDGFSMLTRNFKGDKAKQLRTAYIEAFKKITNEE